MANIMIPSKRPRAPSFSEKHPKYVGSSDWLPAEKDKAQVQLTNFLELCRFCKKNLRHDEDVFMYGSVFCFFSSLLRYIIVRDSLCVLLLWFSFVKFLVATIWQILGGILFKTMQSKTDGMRRL